MSQGDPLKCSVYREEAVEVIIEALDCEVCNEKIQEQSARALSMLGGRFSYNGEAIAEKWLLKEAGFDDDSSVDSFQGKDIVSTAGLMYSVSSSVILFCIIKYLILGLCSGRIKFKRIFMLIHYYKLFNIGSH